MHSNDYFSLVFTSLAFIVIFVEFVIKLQQGLNLGPHSSRFVSLGYLEKSVTNACFKLVMSVHK